LAFIQSGKPTQNACIESLNGRFRCEVLNNNRFSMLHEAKVHIAAWHKDYKHSRLQCALPRTDMLVNSGSAHCGDQFEGGGGNTARDRFSAWSVWSSMC